LSKCGNGAFNEEYLQFFFTVDRYSKLEDNEDFPQVAQQIVDRYLPPNGKYFHFEQEKINALMEQIQLGQAHRRVFDQLQADLVHQMKSTILPLFLESDLYKDLSSKNEKITKFVNEKLGKVSKEADSQLQRYHIRLTANFKNNMASHLSYPSVNLTFSSPSSVITLPQSPSLKKVPSLHFNNANGYSNGVQTERPLNRHQSESSVVVSRRKSSSVSQLLKQRSSSFNTSDEFFTLLKDPYKMDYFKRYLANEYQVRNLLFWQSLERFVEDESEQSVQRAQEIYTLFIAPEGQMVVNLDPKIGDSVRANLEVGKLPSLDFLTAQDAVYQLLKNEGSRFQRSPFHKEMMANMPDRDVSKQKRKGFFKYK